MGQLRKSNPSPVSLLRIDQDQPTLHRYPAFGIADANAPLAAFTKLRACCPPDMSSESRANAAAACRQLREVDIDFTVWLASRYVPPRRL